MRHWSLALSLVLALPVPQARAEDVVVFAAASLKTALDRIAADWQMQSGHRVQISYAGSSQLARQIIQGAPADLFISAAENWMDVVGDEGQIVPESRIDLLTNRLVLVGQKSAGLADLPAEIGPGFDLAGVLGGERLSMALVDSVPAGQYGKAALQALGLWDSVQPAIVQSDNVRAALALVETGEAPFGIVYATDARASNKVSVLAVFPEASHPPIVYPMALLVQARDAADRAFHDMLTGPEARAVFEAEGFSFPETGVSEDP